MDSVEKIETTIKSDVSWLLKHERLVLAVIAGLVLWFSIGKIDTLISNHDNANLQQAKIVAQVQQEKNDALTKQVAQDKADYEALVAKVDARDAQLQQLQVQLVTTLAKQQKADASLPLPDLANRWYTLVPEAKLTATPTGITVDEAGAHATVADLEKAPVLEQELAAKTEELTNATKIVAAEGQQVGTLNDLVTGLQTKAVADAKVCTDQIAVVKAGARKSKRRWFYAGVVVGWATRQAVKTYTGW